MSQGRGVAIGRTQRIKTAMEKCRRAAVAMRCHSSGRGRAGRGPEAALDADVLVTKRTAATMPPSGKPTTTKQTMDQMISSAGPMPNMARSFGDTRSYQFPLLLTKAREKVTASRGLRPESGHQQRQFIVHIFIGHKGLC